MENKQLQCKDCYKELVFTINQQKYFAGKGWSAPIRCPACRKIKNKKMEEVSFDSLMRGCTMRMSSKHGHGFFRKIR